MHFDLKLNTFLVCLSPVNKTNTCCTYFQICPNWITASHIQWLNRSPAPGGGGGGEARSQEARPGSAPVPLSCQWDPSRVQASPHDPAPLLSAALSFLPSPSLSIYIWLTDSALVKRLQKLIPQGSSGSLWEYYVNMWTKYTAYSY